MENETVVVPKENKTKTTLALVVIIILFLGLLYVTFTYFTNPKKKVVDSINKFYQNFTEKMSSNKAKGIMSNNIVGTNGKLSIELNSPDGALDKFKNIDLSYDYKEDKEKNRASLSFDSSVNEEKFLEILALAKDDKLYFDLKNLLDKYYYVDYTFVPLLKSDDVSDILYITDIFKENVVKNITNDLFTKSNVEIDLDGKNVKVTKYTMNISNDLINKILTSSLNQIKNDKKAIDILAKYSEQESSKITETIDEALNNVNEDKSTYSIEYNMYVKNFINIVKHEIKIEDTSLAYQQYNDIKEYVISNDSTNFVDIKVNTKNRTISGDISNVKLNGTYTNDNVKLSLTDGNQTINLDCTNNETLNNEEYGINMNLNMSVLSGKEEVFTAVINFKNTTSKEEKIDNVDVSKSVSADEISEEDTQTIMTKLIELPIIKDFYQNYSNSLNNVTTTTEIPMM